MSSMRTLALLVAIAAGTYTTNAVSREQAEALQSPQAMAQLLPLLELCVARFPDFARKNHGAFEAWKKVNAKAIQEAGRDPALNAVMSGHRQRYAETAAAPDQSGVELLCQSMELRILGASPEPGFETPRLAFTRMVDALRRRDVDVAMQSFSPDVRQRYKALFGAMSDDRLNAFVTAFTEIERFALVGADLAFGAGRLPDDQGFEVQLMRINDRWYIVEIV